MPKGTHSKEYGRVKDVRKKRWINYGNQESNWEKEEREEIKKEVRLKKSKKENWSKLRLWPSLVYQHISVNRVASIELYP